MCKTFPQTSYTDNIDTIVHHWMKPQNIHTTAHIAEKLAIIQYCKQDQCPPVKTKGDDIQHEPILTGLRQHRQISVFQSYFPVRKGKVFSYQINDVTQVKRNSMEHIKPTPKQ